MQWRTARIPLALVAIAALSGCPGADDGGSRKPPKQPPPKDLRLPPSEFLWGTATAAYQVEGESAPSDWLDWEQIPGKVKNGDRADDGPRQLRTYDADFAEAKAMGHNAYRFSLDWPRLQRGPHAPLEPDVVAHYHRVFASLRANGLVPMVTLQHFTLPRWLHDINSPPDYGLGGWPGREGDAPGQGPVVAALEDFARKVAREFGGEVDLWVTVNEPMVTLSGGYLAGVFPPGLALDFRRIKAGLTNMAFAHARAYRALHAEDRVDVDGDGRAAAVSIAQHIRVMLPKTPGKAADEHAAKRLDYQFNWALVDMLAFGRLDANVDGNFDDPGDAEDAPELGPSLDWLGLNYYSTNLVAGVPFGDASIGLTLAGLPLENDDPAVPHNDLRWQIYPDGLRQVLVAAWERYHLTIMITENGIADEDDRKRPRFLVDHVAKMQAAMAAGVDVRGYMHWSLIDNFEWAEGFAPRFGLLRVDYSDPSRRRTRNPSAAIYSEIIRANGVTPELRARFGG